MLSDSVFQAIENLMDELHHYSKPPFEYGEEYKTNFVLALANLYYIMKSLDGCGPKNVSMKECVELAAKRVEEALL